MASSVNTFNDHARDRHSRNVKFQNIWESKISFLEQKEPTCSTSKAYAFERGAGTADTHFPRASKSNSLTSAKSNARTSFGYPPPAFINIKGNECKYGEFSYRIGHSVPFGHQDGRREWMQKMRFSL